MRGEGCLVKELPFDGDDASGLGRDLSECTDRKVHAVRVLAGRASVRDGDSYTLAVVGVNDLHLLAAEIRDLAGVSVTARVDSGDKGRVGVDCAAGTSDAILGEESGEAAADEVTVAARSSSGGLGG